MSSDVEICNMALGRVGVAHEISSLDEESTEAEQCNRFYAAARDRLLRRYPWQFAQRYYTLELVAEDPNDDWAYSYRYPSTCLRIQKFVLGGRDRTTRVPWRLAHDDTGKLIFTDQADAVILMTARVTNTELFDPIFVDAFAWELGADVAIPLSRDPKERDRALQMSRAIGDEAFAGDQNESGQEEPLDAESIRARE